MARRRSRRALGALGEPISGTAVALLVGIPALLLWMRSKAPATPSSTAPSSSGATSSSGTTTPSVPAAPVASEGPDIDQAKTQATLLFFGGLDADALKRYEAAVCASKDYASQCDASKWFSEYSTHEERAS